MFKNLLDGQPAKKYSKDTDELFTELKTEKCVENFLSRNQDEIMLPLNEYLGKILSEKNLSKADVIKRSGLNREYAYHIFSGTRNPSQPKVLALALAMNLNLDETQRLLRHAQQSLLYPRKEWDAIIISAIEQKLSVMETNELLHRLGEEIFLE